MDKLDRKMRTKACQLIRQWTKEEAGKPKDWWNGVAPSYLCSELGVNYDEACEILLDLEAQRFIYDNKHGNQHRLKDGRTCATRFYLKEVSK